MFFIAKQLQLFYWVWGVTEAQRSMWCWEGSFGPFTLWT